MGLGTSLFLIAVGAILRFAVTVSTRGFNLHTIGLILMVIGVIGLVISLFWMTVWASRRDRAVPVDEYDRRRSTPPPETYAR
jgi:sulfite exporter TauE/SafE